MRGRKLEDGGTGTRETEPRKREVVSKHNLGFRVHLLPIFPFARSTPVRVFFSPVLLVLPVRLELWTVSQERRDSSSAGSYYHRASGARYSFRRVRGQAAIRYAKFSLCLPAEKATESPLFPVDLPLTFLSVLLIARTTIHVYDMYMRVLARPLAPLPEVDIL